MSESPKLANNHATIVAAIRSHRGDVSLNDVSLDFCTAVSEQIGLVLTSGVVTFWLVRRTVVMKKTFRVFDGAGRGGELEGAGGSAAAAVDSA